VSIVIHQLKHPDDSYRAGTAHGDQPNALPERPASAKDSPSQPSINAAEQAFKTPWRHPHLICPGCGSSQINRIGRRGVREYFLSVIYVYPFRCESCGHFFRACEWGIRYRRQRRY
jgi:predicted RNA-binding Zn-ribbon protein involved in translation (DUF1610 family)